MNIVVHQRSCGKLTKTGKWLQWNRAFICKTIMRPRNRTNQKDGNTQIGTEDEDELN